MTTKEPVGYFKKDGELISVIPKDDETPEDAVKRVAADHGVDPSVVSKSPPSDEPKNDKPWEKKRGGSDGRDIVRASKAFDKAAQDSRAHTPFSSGPSRVTPSLREQVK